MKIHWKKNIEKILKQKEKKKKKRREKEKR
jgi:hypothetical protein